MEISTVTEKYKLKVNLKERITFFDLSLWLVEMAPGISSHKKTAISEGQLYREIKIIYFLRQHIHNSWV